MQLLSPCLLSVNLLLGLVAGAAVSIPRDASSDITSAFTALSFDTRAPSSDVTSPSQLTKRLTYNGNAGVGNDYYCGEVAGVVESFGPDAPLASDCLAIRARYPDTVRGYWTISVADQNSAPGGWITLAKQGTCAFKVRLEDGQTPRDFRVGTNDVWFYTGYARSSQGTPGRYQGISDVGCNWQRVITTVRWGIVRP
ncbi:hypothetical protein QBC37DRAFT_163261 [Rhypophila decipiens]|uniref:Ecp2 effector protein-like domain-containing protein n=1 Tax=Rhypophila decipiens TaxID=261697 RepID=A0AAN6Y856_9PEZI|nr:hypothetical protein QBC37DRAFT_163261 [Rhypophila decipiens]